MTTRKVALTKIVIDETIYPRANVADFHIARLRAALRTGKLPAIKVEAKTMRIVDGRHRFEAHKAEKLTTIEVIEKVYKSEADLFADAVRCNIMHGEPLDTYTVRTAIIRLQEYGYTRDSISEIVRMPVDHIMRAEKGFAADSKSGKPIALKGGLSHLKGTAVTTEEQAAIRRYGGGKAVFYARQLVMLLEHGLEPPSQAFADEMNLLVKLWTDKIKRSAAA